MPMSKYLCIINNNIFTFMLFSSWLLFFEIYFMFKKEILVLTVAF